jgi:hypothetical protein
MKMAELKEKITVDKYMETLADMVRQKIERLDSLETKLRSYVANIREGKYRPEDIPELVIENLEWIMEDICDEFRNCTVCPIEDACEFARKGCKEMYNCEGCPRLTLCLDREILEVSPKKKER